MNGWCGGRQGLFGWGDPEDTRGFPERCSGLVYSVPTERGWLWVVVDPERCSGLVYGVPLGHGGGRADQRRGREGSGVSDGKGGTRGSRADQRRGCVGTRGGGFGARGWGAVAVAGDGEGVGELGSVPDVVFVIVDSVFLQEVAVFVLKGPCLVVFFLGVDVVEQGFLLAHSHGEGSIAELP